MGKWEDTPFVSVEEAAAFAQGFLRVEPEYIHKPDFSGFEITVDGERILIAQALDGDGCPTGPVKQRTLRKRPPSGRPGAGGPPQFGLSRGRPTAALCSPTVVDRLVALEFKIARLTRLLQSARAHQQQVGGHGLPEDQQVGAGTGSAS